MGSRNIDKESVVNKRRKNSHTITVEEEKKNGEEEKPSRPLGLLRGILRTGWEGTAADEGTPAPTESASPQNTASATQKILTAPPSSEFNPLQLGFGKGISVAQEIRKKIRERIDGGKKFIEEPEDETHLEAQPTDASAQFIRNLQISNEDLSKEPSISREDLISKEQIVIRSSRQPQNQNPKLPLSILKEKHLRNATLGSEETTEHTPSDASTTEGKLMELGHKIMRNLENTVKETIKYLKSLFSHASEVVKPYDPFKISKEIFLSRLQPPLWQRPSTFPAPRFCPRLEKFFETAPHLHPPPPPSTPLELRIPRPSRVYCDPGRATPASPFRGAIRRRRPTPATLVLTSDQSSPEVDEDRIPNPLLKGD
ncbi:hypothetical protein E5288_WYG010209 [Bos mutus]|uniref:Glycosylation-dependent cell adhesion molecule 1 n=1 Tax=Bos mutus TaxID=72004 RepID=A0A6B0RD64_9CETA|nr:hypothetical protein [Bos mutus]